MRITKIVRYQAERIHTDEKGTAIYQRYPGGLWEKAIDSSWYRVSLPKELEKVYQEKKAEWGEKGL